MKKVCGVGKSAFGSVDGTDIDYNYVPALEITLVLDILYGIIDPRIRLASKEG